MAWVGITGYFIGLAVIRPRNVWKLLAIGWLVAAALHGLWDSEAPGGQIALVLIGRTGGLLAIACLMKARQIKASQFGRSTKTIGFIVVGPGFTSAAPTSAAAAYAPVRVPADAFSGDGKFVSVAELEPGLVRIWDYYRASPAGQNALRVEFQVPGYLPQQFCAQAPGRPLVCKPLQLPMSDVSMVTFTLPNNSQVSSLQNLAAGVIQDAQDSNPYLPQLQVSAPAYGADQSAAHPLPGAYSLTRCLLPTRVPGPARHTTICSSGALQHKQWPLGAVPRLPGLRLAIRG